LLDLCMMLEFLFLIPEQYGVFIEKLDDSEKKPEEFENKSFGISHLELGARFVENWWPVPHTPACLTWMMTSPDSGFNAGHPSIQFKFFEER
jgi:hypothetical protein